MRIDPPNQVLLIRFCRLICHSEEQNNLATVQATSLRLASTHDWSTLLIPSWLRCSCKEPFVVWPFDSFIPRYANPLRLCMRLQRQRSSSDTHPAYKGLDSHFSTSHYAYMYMLWCVSEGRGRSGLDEESSAGLRRCMAPQRFISIAYNHSR